MISEKRSSNPWLSISASDYEAHMRSPEVQQLQFLSEVFREILEEYRPSSMVILGCATGNGFEHLDTKKVGRVIGIDINPEYLVIARNRFAEKIPGLELICCDIANCEIEPGTIDLVSCALVLEYIDPAIVIEKVSRWLRIGGVLSIVLQLPSPTQHKVSDTGVESLKGLDTFMKLVDQEDIRNLTQHYRLGEMRSRKVKLVTGKEFLIADYRLRL